jgi:hypothetical protein
MNRYTGRTMTSKSTKNKPTDHSHELKLKGLPQLSTTANDVAIEISVQTAAIACFELIENSNTLTSMSLKQPFPKPSPNSLTAFLPNKPILRKFTYVDHRNILAPQYRGNISKVIGARQENWLGMHRIVQTINPDQWFITDLSSLGTEHQ